MSRPKLRITTLCSGLIAEQRLRQRAVKPAPGPNRTVAPCREAAWAEAAKLGARNIEAVSAGPAQLNKKGQFVGRVRMRIMYQKLLGYEVREATMTCVVDRAGKVVGGAT